MAFYQRMICSALRAAGYIGIIQAKPIQQPLPPRSPRVPITTPNLTESNTSKYKSIFHALISSLRATTSSLLFAAIAASLYPVKVEYTYLLPLLPISLSSHQSHPIAHCILLSPPSSPTPHSTPPIPQTPQPLIRPLKLILLDLLVNDCLLPPHRHPILILPHSR